MGWVSPTGHSDPDTEWEHEERAYDDDLVYYAYDEVGVSQWGSFLELTHAALQCTKVRFYSMYMSPGINAIDLDVYWGGDWHDIYQGSFADQQWVEKELGGTYTVTKARVKFHNNSNYNPYYGRLYEFDFWEVEITKHEWSGSDGIALADSLIKSTHHKISDGIALSDALTKSLSRILADGIQFGDALLPVYRYVRSFTDGIAISDTLKKGISRVITDGVKLTDSLTKGTSKVLVDGLQLGDALVKSIARTLTDPIALTDVLKKGIAKILTDGIAVADVLKKLFVGRAKRILSPFRVLPSEREEGKER